MEELIIIFCLGVYFFWFFSMVKQLVSGMLQDAERRKELRHYEADQKIIQQKSADIAREQLAQYIKMYQPVLGGQEA